MFGIADKNNAEKIVRVQTQLMDVLDTNNLPKEVFHLLVIGSGTIVADIDGHTCHFGGQSVLCLNERRQFHIRGGHATDVRVVSFSPEFLNVNMTPEFLRNPNYQELCDAHSFFQLSPFLTGDPDKMTFRVCDDTFRQFNAAIDQMEKNLASQPDWYWSCRARSHFIDIINILERSYHNYYLPEPSSDTLYPVRLQEDFRKMIVYINNHLNEKITLEGLYKRFYFNKNKLQAMFHRYLGETLQEYLNRRRFEEAAYYLRFTELNGDEIADRLNFSGSQSFSRFFTQICGQTPEIFRKEKVSKRKIDMQELHKIEEESRKIREAACAC